MDCPLDNERVLRVSINIFCNIRDITKCQSFLHYDADDNDEKAELNKKLLCVQNFIKWQTFVGHRKNHGVQKAQLPTHLTHL